MSNRTTTDQYPTERKRINIQQNNKEYPITKFTATATTTANLTDQYPTEQQGISNNQVYGNGNYNGEPYGSISNRTTRNIQ
jgi:hypothetical protein